MLGVRQHYLGVAFPFGRLEATDLATLALVAKACGGADIRLTPWRSILIIGLTPPAARALSTALDLSRFLLDPGDPRLAVAACPGAPACASGSTDTRADATTLAAFAPRRADGRIALHVSGCAKGCAHAGAVPITLVADAGRYALVRNGNAQSPAVATGLTLRAAAAMLADMSAEGGAAA